MDRRFATVAAAATGVTAVLALAAPAQAAGRGDGVTEARPTGVGALADYTHCRHVYKDGVHSGTGCFQSSGDKFLMDDTRADGLRVVAEWYTDYGRAGECHMTSGSGGGWAACDYDMAENGYVKFRVTLRNGADGANQAATSWSGWLPIGG
ncbi:hypothetical protein ACE14D_09360 [Streptomyces sp. Act-28]